MSVRKNLRHDSKIEYLNRFQELYKYTVDKACGVPKRKYEDLGAPLIDAMNSAQNSVMNMMLHRRDKSISKLQMEDMTNEAIKILLDSRPHFIAFFNIERLSFNKECFWAELFNNTIYYLGVAVNNEMEKKLFLPVIDYNASKNAKFVNNMRELHRYIYSKVISSPRKVHNTSGKVLIYHADNALYHIVEGNKRIPKNSTQYQKRTNHFKRALTHLQSMSPAMVALFNLQDFSEEKIRKLSQLHYDEVRMLKAVMNSDKKLYSNLQ